LCGAVRYAAKAAPVRTTICHCRFCQRVTGGAFLVEPIFNKSDVVFSGAAPRRFAHRSDGSGKQVTVHFCGACSAALCLAFERVPDVLGVCAGTFDDPNWFDRSSGNCRHIFTRSAMKGVVLPADVEIYEAHAQTLEGASNRPAVYAEPFTVE
jgi:hypothetical protein